MTPLERRASLGLAGVFALRMLGLFLVLPVFALEAVKYPGGDDAARVGLAMGIYGLTQALLQFAFGLASDRFGRKPVIVFGLGLFALGSIVAASAPNLDWLIAGRACQGAGAISAAVTALLADLTRDEVRTKGMALIGVSIGLMFALSLVLAPLVVAAIGLQGLFVLIGLLAVGGMAVVLWAVPAEPAQHAQRATGRLADVLQNTALLRLNLGVFVLHAVQLAMWMAVPALLVQVGLAKAAHWQVYLPAVLGSFLVMGVGLFRFERLGYLRAVFLSAIGLLSLVQLGFLWSVNTLQGPSLLGLGTLLFLFFCSFNVLEATQPSLVSRMAPAASRGAALGAYNTLQSLGLFAGGAMGGWLIKTVSTSGLFATCTGLTLLWLLLAWPMRVPKLHS